MTPNVTPRQMNAAGLELIKRHEGLRLEAYLCPGGILTIGYGHTGDVKPGQVISAAQADALLKKDVARFEKGVAGLVTKPLRDNQFAALVCFSFNVGLRAFANSTLLNLLNRGWYEQVPAQLLRWTTAQGRELSGLLRRRQDEAQLWNTEDA